MKISAFSIFLLLLLLSCNETLKRNQEKPHPAKQKLVAKINFYRVDSIFLKYLPDTAIAQFKTLEDLNNYSSKKVSDFLTFCKNEKLKNKNDSVSISIRSAQIQFYHLMNVLYLRQLWNLPRNTLSMVILSFYSSLTDENNMDQTIRLFNSFPQPIKKSSIGKKTWARIQQFLPDRNIGFDMNRFGKLKLMESSGKNCSFSEIINDRHKFHILVFGASWCLPCRADEKQLQLWMPQIDSSKIKIIGFSIDTNTEEWRNYLKEEQYPWKSYLMEGEWHNEILKILHFKTVPMNFLIDKNGKIIMQNPDMRTVLQYLSELI